MSCCMRCHGLRLRERYKFDILVLLHVTTPLREPKDIDRCIELLIERGADNVFSVTEAHRNPYFNMVEIDADGCAHPAKEGNFHTRQSAPVVYDMNSSIYVWWREIFREKRLHSWGRAAFISCQKSDPST